MKMIVNGVATEYLDEGTGSVVLMLHGWKDSLHTFDALAGALAGHFRIVRLDMPGFGGTELPRTDLRLDDYVDFVAAFIVKLQLDVDIILGHSFGGRVILKGVSTGALQAKKIVLIAAAGVADRSGARNSGLANAAKIGKFLTAPLPATFRARLRRRLYRAIGSDYHASGTLRNIFLNVIREDLSYAATCVQVPTLLIWGSEDRSTMLSEGEKLSRLIPGAQFTVFPSASHFVHQEKMFEIAALIETFV